MFPSAVYLDWMFSKIYSNSENVNYYGTNESVT